jgi:hypothetical protein
MKKWMYLIFPGALLAIFLVFYLGHQKEAEKNEAIRKDVAKQKEVADKKAKDESEERARKDAAQKQAEREAEDKKKEDERRAKTAAIDKEIRDGIAAAVAEGDKFHKEATALEVELDRLKKEKDRVGREAFEMAKQVEAARVARRNAELESQRMLEMITRRAADSSLTRMPVIPPPPPVAPKA